MTDKELIESQNRTITLLNQRILNHEQINSINTSLLGMQDEKIKYLENKVKELETNKNK